MTNITGHHHISMLTKNATQNNHFYTHILGLRRVKKTVNQDSPSMYHLFYGDNVGSAGTELTFFEMPIAGSTTRGTNAITKIGLFVPSHDSLIYWQKRLAQFAITTSDIQQFAGREALFFEDNEGLRLALISHDNAEIPAHWHAFHSPDIASEHRILGMGTVEITVRDMAKTIATLTDILHYTVVTQDAQGAILQSSENNPYGEIILTQQDGPSERPGRGSVHHLAIRVKDNEELAYWHKKIEAARFINSGIVDRFYFHSLYFRDANNILFELATDGPGFTADSTIENLGKDLSLPPFLEPRRAEIKAKLQPLE